MRRIYASGDWVVICYTKVMASVADLSSEPMLTFQLDPKNK